MPDALVYLTQSQWPADVAMTTNPPIGYITMNDHSGPLVEDSERAEYQVLVPIYGFTQQDDKMFYKVNMVSRVLKHKLISVWTWPDRSYDSQLGYFNVIPSSSANGPSLPPSIPSQDLMQPPGFTSTFSEELSWPANMRSIPEHASLCQTVIANLTLDNPWTTVIQVVQNMHYRKSSSGLAGSRDALPLAPFERTGNVFIIYLLNNRLTFDGGQYNHKPNNFASDWRKVIGHCLQPGGYMGFCTNQDQLRTRTTRMLAALETQLVSDSADYDVIAEIIGLQMAKEIWHHIVLHPVASNPSISIADIYWDQILDQQGDVSLEVVAFIVCLFYEWCQKVLNVTLDRTAAANVILIYKRILHLKGPPLDKIQHIARDLGFIRDINVYGVDKDGRYKRQALGPLIRTPVCIRTLQVQHLQELMPAFFFNQTHEPHCLHREAYTISVLNDLLKPGCGDGGAFALQSTFASLPFSTETFKFNLELTAAELALIENALGQVNRNQEALPLLERVRYLRTLPGTSQGLPLIHDSMNDIDDLTSLNSHAADSSSEDDAFLAAVEKSFTYRHKFSASVEDFFCESLASDDDEEAIDETSLDTEATNEDYDSYLDNSNDNIEPNRMWQAQATSIQSASFITSDALIATLATPHAESTASHLNVQVWVDNTMSYLKQQEGIQLGVCSIEAMIARCRNSKNMQYLKPTTYFELIFVIEMQGEIYKQTPYLN
ncbi:hypothetical protein DFH29DRAFT_883245 [Suillus ampliporus]|nr:hypothetical protein DFH29DRAFT_883245 [Suillus ampliporus]